MPATSPESRITAWLRRAPQALFVVYAVGAAFSAYFCMYAFRKPFAVALYHGARFGPLGLKSALIISQVVGYALSKIIGVKVISELDPRRRARALVLMVLWAEAALLLFAVLPPAGKVVAIFLNGLPLGAVWGLTFGYLEGRRTSEILGAGLSVSYIVSSGAVKTAGKALLDSGVSESWMPAATGLIFLPAFLLAVWLLDRVPPPSPEDVAARVEREPMDARERRAFFLRFLGGLGALTLLYFFLTAYRDFRDNFAADIFANLGLHAAPTLFTMTEIPIALVVLVALGLLYLVRDNRLGLFATHAMMLVGTLLVGVATLLFDAHVLGGVTWMVLVGLGLYLAYVPYGCVLFDRLIAAMGVVATSVFMIYVTDAVGYVGSVGVVLYKNFEDPGLSMMAFFRGFSYFTSILCSVCFVLSWIYFARRSRAG